MVDVRNIGAKTTVTEAINKAQEIARELSRLTPSDKPVGSRVSRELENLAALISDIVVHRLRSITVSNAFMYELGRPFGGVSAVAKTLGEGTQKLDITNAGNLTGVWWMPVNKYRNPTNEIREVEGALPGNGAILIPITKEGVKGGLRHTYSLHAFTEKGEGSAVEQYVDIYLQAEVGAGLSTPFVSFGYKGGIKTGEKQSFTKNERQATRQSRQVSKSFNLQTIFRNVILLTPNFGQYLSPLNIQYGYRVKQIEGGEDFGPFWAELSVDQQRLGDLEVDLAHGQAMEALRTRLEESASELARNLSPVQ